MKLLCIGKSGQIARALAERSAARGIACVCLGRPMVDLEQPETLVAAIDQTKPTLVVNAAAYTNVDGAETDTDTAIALNAIAPGLLAKACQTAGIPLVHISTDYVFSDPSERPLLEEDPVRGVNAYGRSKAAGEAAVRDGTNAHIILRTSWVYSPFGRNFVKTMLRVAEQDGEARVVDDQIGSPTSALDIAEAILDTAPHLFETNASERFGTYHYAASGYASWADLAALIFQLYEAKTSCKIGLKRIPSSDYATPAARPHNSRLDTRKIAETFGVFPRDWKAGVIETVDRLLAEKGTGS
ncbi:MAG: dTDP-4-dehydrorhamnose reductase [Pseudomonadota bacterium]